MVVAVGSASTTGKNAVVKVTDTDSNQSNALAVVQVGTDGNAVSVTNTEYTEDAAAPANPVGGALILVRRDTLTAAEVTTDGDNVAAKATSKGQLHVYSETGAAENHIGQVGSPSDIIDVTLSLDTNAYDSGDVLAATQAVAGALRVSGGKALLQSIALIDIDDQKAAMTLVFLSANTSIGAENAPPDIDDTEILDVLGTFAVAGGDYVDLGTGSVASFRNVGLLVEAASGTSIWVAAITGGTPTHSATGLKLRLGFLQS